MKFLQLIRYQNLLLIALMQFVFRYGFLKHQELPLTLYDWQYGLLVLATLLIAAGGYVINDIMDQETDRTNKPGKVIVGQSISEATAYNWYFGLNIAGMLIGYYLADFVNKTSFFGIFIISSALLYLYATSLKQMAVVGNVIVALILAFSVIIIGMFDIIPLFPYVSLEQSANMKVLLAILLDYAIFAFIINLMREIVKDAEDMEGDDKEGMRTLPVIIGITKTTRLVFGIGLLATALLLWYINDNLMNNQLYTAVIYSLITVIGPMVFFLIKIWNASTKNDFRLLSAVLKYIILFGILSVIVITYNIKANG
ncbi:geranylgeranylglycerol-phosphate geranylgeranyltransferase [Flavobacterium sedimenticola]|uniref:Geranylgeranylglycerol-phosphate geranylgeranyltransferase n=1 Tax=Flavobacterium sedimenticola TaxID=3043286 RepID=A0ABT6XTD9_9FLAO|nr:geranylgeranylglycerol-phosphate geranylgeranyltransferase [Flavobacterium sedimenticola]MDI9258374.1 geranylgeranylglycerol-phosphate geranylgeranyltransferase [Flavobacterium sedimenticola]